MKRMKLIVNSFVALTFALVATGCGKSNNANDNEQIVAIDFDEAIHTSVDELIENVEVIPLEIKAESYPRGALNILACDSSLFIKDSDNIIYQYSDKGNYINDSKIRKGRGAGEYSIMMAAGYNKHTGEIEIVTPKNLLTYDRDFNFIRSIDLPTRMPENGEESFFFGEIHSISPDQHLFIPTGLSEDNRQVILFDSKSGEILNSFDYSEGLLSDVCMQTNSFYDQSNGEILFFPPGISKFAYSLNPSDFTFNKVYEVSYGKDGISDADIAQFNDDKEGLKNYFLHCDKTMPMRTLQSGDNTIILTSDGDSFKNLHAIFYNRTTGKISSINNYENDKFNFPVIDAVNEGSIYGITVKENVEPMLSEISKDKILMPASEIQDGSYIVLRYKLK